MGIEKRGFASMDKTRLLELTAKGGRESHARGTGHQFTSEEGVKAGRKGGRARAIKMGQKLKGEA